MASDHPEPDADEADAIIRVTTYHRRDKDRKVISFESPEHDQVKTCIAASHPNSDSATGLGTLGSLPTELLVSICLRLDIESLFKFRQVDNRSRDLVTGIFEYRAVTTHALDAFLALFRTGLAKYITLPKFYQPLREKWCTTCGEFAGFVFLPTAMRCCLKCIDDPLLFPVLTLSSVTKRARISAKRLEQMVPTLVGIPGWYGHHELSRMQRHKYVSFLHACEAVRSVKGGEVPNEQQLVDAMLKQSGRFNCEDKHQASVAIPAFDPTTSKAYWGLSCKGCATEMERFGRLRVRSVKVLSENIDRIYAREEFLAHFETCDKAKGMWVSSEGGTKDISHMESRFSANGGFHPARIVAVGAWAW